jgi:chemotaxis protein CheD
VTVSISDARIIGGRAGPGDVLVTHSLGSCIGVAVHDPVAKIAGLLHFQLPESKMDPKRAAAAPLMFGDTGIDWLLQEIVRQGGSTKRLTVKLAGGASMLTASKLDIGRRNHALARRHLWKHGLFVAAEDCGGSNARTLYLRREDGAVRLRVDGRVTTL